MLNNSYQNKKKKKEAEFVGLGQSQKTISATKPSLVQIHWPVYPCKEKHKSFLLQMKRMQERRQNHTSIDEYVHTQFSMRSQRLSHPLSSAHIKSLVREGFIKILHRNASCCSLTRIIHSTHTHCYEFTQDSSIQQEVISTVPGNKLTCVRILSTCTRFQR